MESSSYSLLLRRLSWLLVLASLLLVGRRRCSGCVEEERKALLDIKAAFTIPGFSFMLDSWDEGGDKDCCRWERVTCDSSSSSSSSSAGRRIAQLDLSSVWRFAGVHLNTLNASLFLPFPQLRNLTLSFNAIGFWLPPPAPATGSKSLPKSTSLSKLEYLDISFNVLNESIFPSLTISGLTSLKSLLLDLNQIRGEFPIKDLSLLKNLETLDLSHNFLSGGLQQLEGWPFLKELSLGHNMFNGTLPIKGFCNMKNLEILDLSENTLTGSLPPCIANLTSLSVLDLSDNQFQVRLPSIIANLTSLEYLSFFNNQLDGILHLNTLSNYSKLKTLQLDSSTDLLEVETESPVASPLFQLESLGLSNCNLNRKSGSAPPSFISSQHKLESIDLSSNALKGDAPFWFLENKTTLLYLDLRNNSFTGPLILPRQLNTSVIWLDLSKNSLNGSLTTIGISLSSLEHLNLSQNSFGGAIPSTLGQLGGLNNLDLSSNHLSGPISVDLSNKRFYGICNNTNLMVLDISNNLLSGELPTCMGNLMNLYFLNARVNSLGGQIPSSFCNLQELRVLDLSENSLSGSIPSCLNLSSLQYLHLYNNSLAGSIPSALSNSPFLKTIDLRSNHLAGDIPSWIGEAFQNLRILLLKENQLEGTIPDQLCHLKNLRLVDLSHNDLSGRIPSCLGEMGYGEEDDTTFKYGFYVKLLPGPAGKVLERYYGFSVLDEEEFVRAGTSNLYKGDVLNYLAGMDLSCNCLEGGIPPELGNMTWLVVLNLSNNHLSGAIPATLSRLTELESLDLSHNMLSGRIPRELIELHELAAFSVAYNELSGPTLGMDGQFITFGGGSYEGNPELCDPPLNKSCAAESPTSLQDDEGGDTERYVFFAYCAVSFAIGFWGCIALLHWKDNWCCALYMVTDQYIQPWFAKAYVLLKRMKWR